MIGARLAGAVTAHPWRALGLSALLVAGLGVGLYRPGVAFETDNRIWFVEDDPSLAAYDRLPRLFGDNKFLVVALTAPAGVKDVFNRGTFETAAALTAWLEDQPVVRKVRSLSTYEKGRFDDGSVVLERIWPVPARYGDLAGLRRALAGDELVVGSLISRDLRSTLLYAKVESLDEDTTPYAELTLALEEHLERMDRRGHAINVAGEPLFNGWLKIIAARDSALITPATLLATALLLWLMVRRFRGVWPALLIVIGAVGGTLGFTALVGNELNMLNISLLNILLPVCIADCVHVAAEFFRRYRRDEGGQGNAPQAAAESVRTLFIPCTLTTLTTAVGFLALCPSRLLPVRELGYEAAFGVTLALVLSLVAFPAALALYRGRPLERRGGRGERLAARLARGATAFCGRHRWPIILGAAALAGAAGYALPGLRAETHNNDYFRPGSPQREQSLAVDRILGGSNTLEVVVDSGKRGGIKEPGFLRQMERLSAWIEAQKFGAKPLSLVDHLKRVNETLRGVPDPVKLARTGVRDYRYLPDNRQAVAQMLLLHDSLKASDGMAAFVDAHQRHYRLPVPLPTLRRSVYEGYMDRIRAYLARELPGLKVDLTGMVQLFATMDAYVLETTQVSFSIAFGVIIVLLFLVLRSARLGLLAIVPNAFPLLLAGGLLAALDISLDFGTTVIASITFGLVVDDTIHFMARMRQRLAAGDGLQAALRHTYEHVGSAIVITSVVIALAFGLYICGAFGPSMRLGAFSALIILLACVADLVLVPALFFVLYPGSVEQEQTR